MVYGFVGTACEQGFQDICDLRIYDKYKDTESLQTVLDNCEILFVCLPTPMNPDGSCNISIIEEVCQEINILSKKRKIIIIKSTVPPGTTEKLQKNYKKHIFVFNPEFLTEKNFINDFLNQDRIVLGYDGEIKNIEKLTNLYLDFCNRVQNQSNTPIYYCKTKEAEMVKYTANCFLATKVMYFNKVEQICKKIGIDYDRVRKISCLDKRIGESHTQIPGHDGNHGFRRKLFC